MKNSLYSLLIVMFAITACTNNKEVVKELGVNQDSISNDYLIMSTLYHQNTAEMSAVCYQTFSLAKLSLERDISDKSIKQKRAVVTDIDETILNNSPYQALCVEKKTNYPICWDEWIKAAQAKALPGAVDFFNYAATKNVEIFYVTNRKDDLKMAILNNLKKEGFPMADEKHLLAKTNENSKQTRRNNISKEYHIALLMGDNLSDFDKVFEDISVQRRQSVTDSLKNEFGKRFIILPNAMYGDWENAIYENKKLSRSEKTAKRKNVMQYFQCEK